MRLIDADALIEDLKGSLFYSDAIPFVEEAPTAYDVEKVEEELLALPQHSNWNPNSDNISRSKAIDAVRNGGVE